MRALRDLWRPRWLAAVINLHVSVVSLDLHQADVCSDLIFGSNLLFDSTDERCDVMIDGCFYATNELWNKPISQDRVGTGRRYRSSISTELCLLVLSNIVCPTAAAASERAEGVDEVNKT